MQKRKIKTYADLYEDCGLLKQLSEWFEGLSQGKLYFRGFKIRKLRQNDFFHSFEQKKIGVATHCGTGRVEGRKSWLLVYRITRNRLSLTYWRKNPVESTLL